MAAVIVGETYGSGYVEWPNVVASYAAGVHTFTVRDGVPTSYGANWAVGDVIFVALTLHSPSDGSGALPAAPVGWTLHDSIDLDCGGGYRQRVKLYSKVRAAGDAATYTFTASSATAQDLLAGGYVLVCRGVKQAVTFAKDSRLLAISFPYFPVNNEQIIAAQYARAGDIVATVVFPGPQNINVDTNECGATQTAYPLELGPYVATASGAQYPVKIDYSGSYGGPPGPWPDLVGQVTAYWLTIPAKKGAGLFGGRLF